MNGGTKPIQSTLCYIENELGQYLMLHRIKKKNDTNHDKWIGIGGKTEEGETPTQCIIRETKEETGLTLPSPEYRGIVYFRSDEYPAEDMHLFKTNSYFGELIDCDEGKLEWIDKNSLKSLPMWEGDVIFLSLIEKDVPFFKLLLNYKKDKLVYAELNGTVIKSENG